MFTVVALVFALSFLGSLGALLLLIWAISDQQFSVSSGAARVIFEEGEEGVPEDPSASAGASAKLHQLMASEPAREQRLAQEIEARHEADASSRLPVLLLIASGVFWLVFGSLLGLGASLKFQFPDALAQQAWLTFGRIRPLHLNTVIYGWLSMGGMGVALWLIPRLFKTPLRQLGTVLLGIGIWNFGMLAGTLALFAGWTDGLEWLEFPWQIDLFFVLGGAAIGIGAIDTIWHRRVKHLYVSSWYLIAAFLWFPFLFLAANLPGVHFGVEHAAMNWWYAHNVLGFWLTPLGLAAAYYFIPKVLGRPIYSY